MRYQYFDLEIDSELQLPELAGGGKLDPRLLIRCDEVPLSAHIRWIHDWHDAAGDVQVRSGYAGEAPVLRFPGLADFVLNELSKTVTIHPAASASDETIRHLLLDQVLPRVMGQGQPVVHAGAMRLTSGDAVLFVGDSGAGKSTLLAHAAALGYSTIADDCIMILQRLGQVACVGNYPGLRLYPDSCESAGFDTDSGTPVAHYTTKRRLATSGDERHQGAHHPIRGICILAGAADTSRIEPLAGSEALLSLTRQLFFLDPSDYARVSHHMMLLASLVNAGTHFLKVICPDDLTKVRALCEQIEHRLSGAVDSR